MITYSIFIIIFFFVFCKVSADINLKYEKEIEFLWERYLLLRLYIEFKEQQTSQSTRDLAKLRPELKLDFDKLPYYSSKFNKFHFSVNPILHDLSPDLINRLYQFDKQRLNEEKAIKLAMYKRMVEISQSNEDIFDSFDDSIYKDLSNKSQLLIIKDFSNLIDIQRKFEKETQKE